jgi:soluble cytochrome b562
MTTRKLVAALLLGLAQQPQQPAAPPTTVPAGPQPKPAVPVATTALTAHADQYAGATVSLTAAVAQVYGATAFSVAQANQRDRAADVLVVAPVLTAPVQPGGYVTVIGDVIRFDSATLATRMKEAAPALAPDVIERYRGRPAIVATSVINGAMTDLAKKLPPPMTPGELILNKAMKQVGPAFTALRTAAGASNASESAAQAAALKTGFTEAAVFWKTQTHPDATQWTADALKMVDDIAGAADKGDMDAVKAAVPKLQQICGNCHTAYRERLDDGSYRYKQAVK